MISNNVDRSSISFWIRLARGSRVSADIPLIATGGSITCRVMKRHTARIAKRVFRCKALNNLPHRRDITSVAGFKTSKLPFVPSSDIIMSHQQAVPVALGKCRAAATPCPSAPATIAHGSAARAQFLNHNRASAAWPTTAPRRNPWSHSVMTLSLA